MKKTTPVKRWTKDRAQAWYARQAWPCGFNYIPANAISYTEMWMPYCFDPDFIGAELDLAAAIGFNVLRVVLPFVVWEHDPAAFRERFDTFLSLCARRGIRVMPALFDDCAFGKDEKLKNPRYGKQPNVIKGWYANGWTPSPGHAMVRDRQTWKRLERYVQDLVGAFRYDSRVWVWDVYNEPTNGGLGAVSIPLVKKVFAWARAAGPSQPLTIGVWNDDTRLNRLVLALSDLVSFHNYLDAGKLARQIVALKKHGRPLVNTEWLKRDTGSTPAACLPVFMKHRVGCLHWGLVNGKTQTHLAWGWRPGRGEPKTWQHDLFHSNHRPYRPAELACFSRHIKLAEKHVFATQ